MRKDNIKTSIGLIICFVVFVILINISPRVYSTSLETHYTADYGRFEGELYFETLRGHSSLFCNHHGAPFFFFFKTKSIPNIILQVPGNYLFDLHVLPVHCHQFQ